eukprot:XP_001611032.1 hypothetical protein [Babesia bovis T2Bo]
MAKGRIRDDSRQKIRRRKQHIDDEEISEGEAFDEEDERKYGRFFQNKDEEESEGTGELWNCLFDESLEADEEDVEEPVSLKNEQISEKAPSRKSKPVDGDEFDKYVRQEEDADLITEDVENEDVRPFDWITESTDGDSKYTTLINKFRAIHKDLPEVFKEESRTKTHREERKELYTSIKKEVEKRWEPVLHHVKRQKHITYGDSGDKDDPTYGSLTEIDIETDLEKELENHTNAAYERALYARDLRKQKRINRIKSKNWHKRQKKRDLELYAKLIEKSQDPELTKELLESFEQKRSKHRVLRKRAAQEKWAKMAMRFGDRSVLKQISSAQQQLKDDLHLIKDTIDAAKEESSDEEDPQQVESESESGDEPADPEDEVLAKLQIISNPAEAEVPQKGLFALKFMKEGLQTKIAQQKEGNVENKQTISLRDQADDFFEQELPQSDSDDEGQDEPEEPDPTEITFTSGTKTKISDDDLAKAMKEIQRALGGDVDEPAKESNKTQATNIETTNQGSVHTEKEILQNSAHASSKCDTPPVEKDNAKPESVDPLKGVILSEDTGLENFIKNLGPVKKKNDTDEMVKRLFVTRPEEENYLSDDEVEAVEDSDNKLKGWGSWTGFGIVDKAPKTTEPEVPKNKKSKVKISNNKETHLNKYLLHRVCFAVFPKNIMKGAASI